LTGLRGDKRKEGDLRTPIGVYKLNSILNDVNEYYGPFAFETNYPNIIDRINKKRGHGIWIHGMPLKSKRESNNTRGCIVMKNSKLKELKKEIDYKNTLLYIAEDNLLTTNKDEIASILAFIYKWRAFWQRSDFKNYISLYSKEFKRVDGMDYKRFYQYKQNVFKNKKGKCVSIGFFDISIVPYQNIANKKIFKIEMNEVYKSPNYFFKGKKILFITLNPEIKIIIEQ
jgi:murein L,D-transpeptidase YafK